MQRWLLLLVLASCEPKSAAGPVAATPTATPTPTATATATATPTATATATPIPIPELRSAESIKRITQSSDAKVRACYRRLLPTYPELDGQVAIRLDLDSNGKVTAARGTAATNLPLPDAVHACIVDVMLALVFPTGPIPVSLVVHVNFGPRHDAGTGTPFDRQ